MKKFDEAYKAILNEQAEGTVRYFELILDRQPKQDWSLYSKEVEKREVNCGFLKPWGSMDEKCFMGVGNPAATFPRFHIFYRVYETTSESRPAQKILCEYANKKIEEYLTTFNKYLNNQIG